MDLDDVKSWVYKFTEREKRYLLNDALPRSYDLLSKKFIQGKQVYLFNHGVLTDDILVQIHPRFIAVPPHVHEFIELAYVYSGQFSQIINGKCLTLRLGDLLIVDTGVVHATEKAGEKDIIINILIRQSFFTTDFLKRALRNSMVTRFVMNAISHNKQHGSYVIFNTQGNRRIPKVIDELMIENHSIAVKATWEKEKKIINENYVLLLFLELCREWACRAVSDLTSENTEEKIMKALAVIEEEYPHLTIKSLSGQLGISANYLGRLLKQRTGKTFKDLVHEKRLARAAALLRNTTMPVYEISSEVGYENLTFFYKKFKEKYDALPHFWRQQ